MFQHVTRREFIRLSSLATLGLVVAGCGDSMAASGGKPADTVIYGNFYTVDEKNPKAEAVAILDGTFVYVGAAAGVKAYIGKTPKSNTTRMA
ncbi:MAG: hypothetical protein IKN64_00125 [Desulfovibrio sp.]|nr:hypothetical protein [Desulfovibrio sp.]